MEPSELIEAARAWRDRSYAPYSKFRAASAVLTDGGEVVQGVIVENVSLGLAMCAERVALFSTVARGSRPAALALVAPKTGDGQTWPCGACLQVALELGGPELPIYVASVDGDIAESKVADLLPRGPHVDH